MIIQHVEGGQYFEGGDTDPEATILNATNDDLMRWIILLMH